MYNVLSFVFLGDLTYVVSINRVSKDHPRKKSRYRSSEVQEQELL